MDTKITEKIKKLLDKTIENGCTPEEAAISMAKAQELMAKHHLSMKDIEAKDEEAITQVIEEKTKGTPPHRIRLAAALAEHFRCFAYLSGRAHRIAIIGLPEDVEIFTSVFEFAYKFFKQSVKEFNEKGFYTRSEKLQNQNMYLAGYISGIRESFKKNEEQYALVLVQPKAVTDAVDKMSFGKAVSFSQKTQQSDPTAFLHGFQKGQEVLSLKDKRLQA